jgi:hypothetical protein
MLSARYASACDTTTLKTVIPSIAGNDSSRRRGPMLSVPGLAYAYTTISCTSSRRTPGSMLSLPACRGMLFDNSSGPWVPAFAGMTLLVVAFISKIG